MELAISEQQTRETRRERQMRKTLSTRRNEQYLTNLEKRNEENRERLVDRAEADFFPAHLLKDVSRVESDEEEDDAETSGSFYPPAAADDTDLSSSCTAGANHQEDSNSSRRSASCSSAANAAGGQQHQTASALSTFRTPFTRTTSSQILKPAINHNSLVIKSLAGVANPEEREQRELELREIYLRKGIPFPDDEVLHTNLAGATTSSSLISDRTSSEVQHYTMEDDDDDLEDCSAGAELVDVSQSVVEQDEGRGGLRTSGGTTSTAPGAAAPPAAEQQKTTEGLLLAAKKLISATSDSCTSTTENDEAQVPTTTFCSQTSTGSSSGIVPGNYRGATTTSTPPPVHQQNRDGRSGTSSSSEQTTTTYESCVEGGTMVAPAVPHPQSTSDADFLPAQEPAKMQAQRPTKLPPFTAAVTPKTATSTGSSSKRRDQPPPRFYTPSSGGAPGADRGDELYRGGGVDEDDELSCQQQIPVRKQSDFASPASSYKTTHSGATSAAVSPVKVLAAVEMKMNTNEIGKNKLFVQPPGAAPPHLSTTGAGVVACAGVDNSNKELPDDVEVVKTLPNIEEDPWWKA
ncbi:unnamed protein product [Amoebophrya sp. A120]|nr:unnamed protein product [Amoebophrya sp. A120]|eukprot:GSA120T00005819001.1